DDFALDIAAPRASGDLREKLEGPLARAKIRQVQPHVGVDDSDERDVREVQPLRDHLRADEDVDLARAERAKRLAIRLAMPHYIGVHALHDGPREKFLHGILDLLRAGAGVSDSRILALRAARRRGGEMAADVAH